MYSPVSPFSQKIIKINDYKLPPTGKYPEEEL